MKNILLVDVDSHNMPNLAIMKKYALYKLKGVDVDFSFHGGTIQDVRKYDLVEFSKIFSFTDFNSDCKHIVNNAVNAPLKIRKLQTFINNKKLFRNFKKEEWQ